METAPVWCLRSGYPGRVIATGAAPTVEKRAIRSVVETEIVSAFGRETVWAWACAWAWAWAVRAWAWAGAWAAEVRGLVESTFVESAAVVASGWRGMRNWPAMMTRKIRTTAMTERLSIRS